jgi:outer membrane lipoprotein SlyB
MLSPGVPVVGRDLVVATSVIRQSGVVSMNKSIAASLAVLLLSPALLLAQAPPPPPSGQLAITPLKGQNEEQTRKDIGSCQADAQAHAGANPADAVRSGQAPAAQTATTTKGGAGKGALGGAAAGAVIGEIADDDAGKGAAIGAGVGAIAGGVRRNKAEKEAEAQRQAAEKEKAARQQVAAQQVEQYNLAFRNCLESRGYSAK